MNLIDEKKKNYHFEIVEGTVDNIQAVKVFEQEIGKEPNTFILRKGDFIAEAVDSGYIASRLNVIERFEASTLLDGITDIIISPAYIINTKHAGNYLIRIITDNVKLVNIKDFISNKDGISNLAESDIFNICLEVVAEEEARDITNKLNEYNTRTRKETRESITS